MGCVQQFVKTKNNSTSLMLLNEKSNHTSSTVLRNVKAVYVGQKETWKRDAVIYAELDCGAVVQILCTHSDRKVPIFFIDN